MKEKIRMRIRGSRRSWIYIRISLFLSLMFLYCLDPVLLGSGIMFLIAVCFIIGYYWFWGRDSRKTGISNQLTKEVTEAYPKASDEELRYEYNSLMRREMRLDALLYLCFTVFEILWILALYLAGASEFSVRIGLLILAPALLLLSLACLIRSFLPQRKKTAVPPLEEYISNRWHQQEFIERSERPDLRYQGSAFCTDDLDEPPTFESACGILKPRMAMNTGDKILLAFALVFFFWIPCLMFLLSFAIGSYMVILCLILLITVIIFRIYASHTENFLKFSRKKDKQFRLLRKKGCLMNDCALSAIPSEFDATVLEICFEHTGTVSCRCSVTDYIDLRNIRGRDAYLLMLEKSVLGVFFVKEPKQEAPTAEVSAVPKSDKPAPAAGESGRRETPVLEEPVARIFNEGGIPTGDQIREAAAIRLQSIDPSRKEEWKKELDEYYDVSDIPILQQTKAEESRFSILLQNHLSKALGPHKIREITILDKQFTDEAGMTRNEIMEMKKNPFFPMPLRAHLPLLVGLAAAAGVAVCSLAEKNTGSNMSIAYGVLSAVSGLSAMAFARIVINASKAAISFRKLQKAYHDPEYWNALIETEAYNLFEEQLRESRKNQSED